jgi:hypothetical protein
MKKIVNTISFIFIVSVVTAQSKDKEISHSLDSLSRVYKMNVVAYTYRVTQDSIKKTIYCEDSLRNIIIIRESFARKVESPSCLTD